jgi:glutamate dehydrogenase
MPNSKAAPIESSIYQIIKEASLIYCLPTTPLQLFFQTGQLSGMSILISGSCTELHHLSFLLVQEVIYGYIGWIFSQHFLNRLGGEYNSLISVIDVNNSMHAEVLAKIKKRLRSDTFTREYILEVIKLYPELIKHCYNHFALIHHTSGEQSSLG